MRSRASQALLLGIIASLVPGCVAVGFDDDFANNLFTDLAPLIALFGEKVTMQFMSEATGWSDSFALAMAPLGILTIIVSAIRVGGPSWLKAIIGRARENLAAAEVELLSSTSKEVCELWNGSEIIRSLGSPPVREFICLVPKAKNGTNSNVDDKTKIECITAAKAQEQGYLIAPPKTADAEKAEVISVKANSTTPKADNPPTSDKPAPKIIIARDISPDAPNISLNTHSQKRWEVRVIAVLGTFLQLGALAWFGVATYFFKYLKEEEDDEKKLVSNYGFPCTAAGTVLLVIGLLLCAGVVEGRTEEVTYQTRDGYEARTIWVQQKATVGDQDFGSFAIFANEPRTEITTSRRARDNSPLTPLDGLIYVISLVPLTRLLKKVFTRNTAGSQANVTTKDSVRFSQTVLGTSLGLLGYVVQFIGFREMHYSVSLVQLGAVLFMTIARAYVRRGLAIPPQARPLSPGFELEWLASAIADRDDGPWGDGSSDDSTCGKSWRISTGGDADFKAFSMPDKRTSRKPKQEPENDPKDEAKDETIEVKDEPKEEKKTESKDGTQQAKTNSNNPSHPDQPKAQIVMVLRSQLAKLADWQSPVFPEANSLVRAIEAVMKTLFAEATQGIFLWSLQARYGEFTPATINISLKRENGNWTVNRHEVEAVLSLWLCSLHEKQSVKAPLNGEDVNSGPTDPPNLRLLGRDTLQLRRDLRWWMPRDIRPAIGVTEGTQGPLKVQRSRIVGQGRGVPTCCNEIPMTAITSFWRSELGHDAYDPTDDKVISDAFLATESFMSQKSLFALDLFSSFMGAAAKTLTEPIDGQAEVRPNDTKGVDSWNSFTLHNQLLATMANEIHSTGLGDLNEIYASIIPPLSKENKLPLVDSIIELARDHAKPYERQGDMMKASDYYIWLLRTANTFPIDSNIAAKATAVMVELLSRVTEEVELWKYREGSASTAELQHSIEEALELERVDARKLFAKLMKLYQFQNRIEKFPPQLKDKAIGYESFPPVFNVTHLHRLAKNGKVGRIHDGHSKHDIAGWTPLHYAVAFGHYSEMDRLISLGVDMHARDLFGWTPLHYTCQTAQSAITGGLISKRVNVDAQARNGLAPLHCASIYGHLPIVEQLVEAGANIDIIDSSRNTPAMWAAFRGHRDVLKYLWTDKNSKLRDIRGRTILHLAVLSGNGEIVDDCAGANTEARDRDGSTPLHLAALHGHEASFSTLVDKLGAKTGALDNIGRSPLHLASYTGHTSIIRRLVVEFGADVDSRDKLKRTPLKTASQQGQTAAVLLLEELSARVEAPDHGKQKRLDRGFSHLEDPRGTWGQGASWVKVRSAENHLSSIRE